MMSQVLAMELQPFNIQVLHLAPGPVKTRVTSNGLDSFSVPEGSLWAAYLPSMLRRIDLRLTPEMIVDLDYFTKESVKKVLEKTTPVWGYQSLGKPVTLVWVLKWLPTWFVLKISWHGFDKTE